jgi:hypothetical protein
MKVKIVPPELRFFPPAVDGEFWAQFSALLPYLADPKELVSLYESDFEAYTELVSAYVKFVIETEKELNEKNLLIDNDYSPDKI